MEANRIGLAAAVASIALSSPMAELERPEVKEDTGFTNIRNKPSTKKGGYAVEARLNGANKRARAARKISRKTRNGQHL